MDDVGHDVGVYNRVPVKSEKQIPRHFTRDDNVGRVGSIKERSLHCVARAKNARATPVGMTD
jgi:hypothetical protein